VRKKKTIAIVLAAFILLPLVFSAGLQLFQQYLKHRAGFRLENEILVNIAVPLQKVKWVEEDREVMIDGKMFDIKQFEEKNDLLIATGVWDEKETEVMGILQGFNDGEQTGFIIRAMLLIESIAFVLYWALTALYSAYLKSRYALLKTFYATGFHSRIYQPPKSFSLFPL
jgi:hypothetical protein